VAYERLSSTVRTNTVVAPLGSPEKAKSGDFDLVSESIVDLARQMGCIGVPGAACRLSSDKVNQC